MGTFAGSKGALAFDPATLPGIQRPTGLNRAERGSARDGVKGG